MGIVLPPILAGLLGISSTGGAGPATPPAPARKAAPVAKAAAANALAARGMWIWELSASDGGNLDAIVSEAHHTGVGTLMIKSSDGTSMWTSQFNPEVVAQFHRAGLKVCAWQYVYGNSPATEAALGAQAVRDGADCLLIDAEGEYEGKYISAQTYIKTLRAKIGYGYPVALAGLPYVDYHPAFPYSVFMGPGGAQYDVPQMYWRDIGTTTDGVFAHTYEFNLLYRRPIYPLGQIYNSPTIYQVLRFRQLSRLYGSTGISWWDWQEASTPYFIAVSRPVGSMHGVAAPGLTYASVGLHAVGDVVVWAQLHLLSAGEHLNVDGDFGPATMAAVESFQSAHQLPVTGAIDAATWTVLLRERIARVHWVIRKGHQVATAASAGGARAEAVPRSAHAPDRGEEIPRNLGAGGRPGHL
jgi:hypothetical protein